MVINLLITGSRGYIGSSLMEYLRHQYFINSVIGFDLANGDDILDYESLVQVLTTNKINIVIHLAAISSVPACNDNYEEAIRVNGIGTRTLLNAMKSAGCKHIIYASTSSVYGKSKKFPYKEDIILEPCSDYGMTKLLGELTIYNHYHIKGNQGSYLIFRMFNVVGTSGFKDIDTKASAGYDRLFGALELGEVTIYGTDYKTEDGTCKRDYISLKDVCRAYALGIVTIFLDTEIRETLNICTEIPLSVKDIISTWNLISTAINDKQEDTKSYNNIPHIKTLIGPRREGDPAIVCGSNKRAFHVIGWKPLRKMEVIIRDLAMDKKLPNEH